MKPSRALALGLVAYGVFLVATLPAAFVAGPVGKVSNGQVRLANAAGTVWNGAAKLELALPRLAATVDEVRWNFLPTRLAAGRLAFAVEARAAGLTANLEIARGPLAWRVRGLRAGGEAAALASLHPPLAIWQPGGTLAVEAEELAWDGRAASGKATVEWRDAALALSAVRPLGTWRGEAQAAGREVKVALATVRGPLRLSGSGTQPIDGRLTFSGEARAEPGRERELEPLLALLGARRADGARALAVR